MRKLSLAIVFFIISHHVFSQQKIKIACIGNSITYGAGMADRANNNYPNQLQNMLGQAYEVKNFGRSSATLLKKGNFPYWKTKEYENALAYKPDVVLIKLGTNDSKAINRPFFNEFINDYKELINTFQRLPSRPRIILFLPVPSFLEDSNSIYDPVIKSKIIPMIQEVAYDAKVELINLYPYFIEQPGLLPDKIHPSSLGATIIAKRAYEAVKLNTDRGFNIFSKIKQEKKLYSFYGFDGADFNYAGRNCKIVKPRVAAKGHPWVWRARFWGHEPQADISLLERGFHIVYCDVAELFGNKESINIWNKFYALMQQAGLNKKVALEGMSRGGVYVYNWALANPGKVACIYADAPVLDLKSWPGGKGKGPGSKSDWEIFKKDYQLTEEQSSTFNNSPLDNAVKIAKLGFPMLHVVGDADEVVPVQENTNPFAQKIKTAGGDIEVIHKPKVRHHPHSLKDPTRITNFILAATGDKINFATIAAPGAEYRSGAGWTEGKGWWQQKENIDSLVLSKKSDIVFLGNSITQGTAGQRTYVTHKPGLAVFDSVFGKYKWESAGISGDRTQNVLYRLQHGNFIKAQPKVMVVTIGVNNFIDGDSPKEIADGIITIANWIKVNMPQTQLILCGPLPTGLQSGESRRKKLEKIHSILAAQNHRGYTYLPVIKPFLLPNGDLNPEMYSGDGIHLITGGYRAWALALHPVIEKYLNKK